MNLQVSPRLDAYAEDDRTVSAPIVPLKGTIPFIEVARAIAPLIVLWVHLAPGWCALHASSCYGDNYWTLSDDYFSIVNGLHLNDWGAHIGVLLFFLVSGFIISHVAAIETRREFIVKRIFRIVPMLFVGVVATYAASSVLVRMGLEPAIGFRGTSHADLIRSMFLMDWFLSTPFTLAVTWTLVTEVSFYAMMFVAYLALARSPVAGTFLLILAAVAIEW
jgi:peptidoglycan/LPS O-acetylase OafA/YrhL